MAKLILRRSDRERSKVYLQVLDLTANDLDVTNVAILNETQASTLTFYSLASWLFPEDEHPPKQTIHCPNCQHEIGKEA
jgi:hypothetical protein